jgi:hypothetical protein
VRLADLPTALNGARRCRCQGDAAIVIAVEPQTFGTRLRRFTNQVTRAIGRNSRVTRGGVEADAAAWQFGEMVAGAVARFCDGAVIPPSLLGALDRCRSWAAGQAAEALGGLRRDGMDRLGAHLETLTAPAVGDPPQVVPSHQRFRADAEGTVAGADGDDVACLFLGIGPLVDAAVAAAAASARRRARDFFTSGTAVAIVPRHVAVLFAAHYAIAEQQAGFNEQRPAPAVRGGA